MQEHVKIDGNFLTITIEMFEQLKKAIKLNEYKVIQAFIESPEADSAAKAKIFCLALLDKEAGCEIVPSDMRLALGAAIERKQLGIVKFLVPQFAELYVNRVGEIESLLTLAVDLGYSDMLGFLLPLLSLMSEKAQMEMRCRILMGAAAWGHLEIVKTQLSLIRNADQIAARINEVAVI